MAPRHGARRLGSGDFDRHPDDPGPMHRLRFLPESRPRPCHCLADIIGTTVLLRRKQPGQAAETDRRPCFIEP